MPEVGDQIQVGTNVKQPTRNGVVTDSVARQMLRVAQVVMLRSPPVGAGSWECS